MKDVICGASRKETSSEYLDHRLSCFGQRFESILSRAEVKLAPLLQEREEKPQCDKAVPRPLPELFRSYESYVNSFEYIADKLEEIIDRLDI